MHTAERWAANMPMLPIEQTYTIYPCRETIDKRFYQSENTIRRKNRGAMFFW